MTRSEHAGQQQRVHQDRNRTAASRSTMPRHRRRAATPTSTLPPSSGGIGSMLNTASSTLRQHRNGSNAIGEHAGRPSTDVRHGRAASTSAAPQRRAARLLTGPAAATSTKSRRGDAAGCAMFTGTGFAQPISGSARRPCAISGNSTVPIEIDVHDRIQRHAAEHAARSDRPAGWPSTRAPPREPSATTNRSERGTAMIDASQELLRSGPAAESIPVLAVRLRAKCIRGRRRATFGPTTAVSSSRVARRTPARLPNVVSSALRRRGPMPGTSSSSDRRSRMVRACRWNVTAKRCASSRIRCTQPQRRIVVRPARSARRGRA